MIRFVRDLRLIPIALIASVCLLTLKTADIVFHGSSLLQARPTPAGDAEVAVRRALPDGTQPPGTVGSWAQQMFNFPSGDGSGAASSSPSPIAAPRLADRDSLDITGSVTTEPAGGDGKKPADNASDAKANDVKPGAPGKNVKAPPPPPNGTVIPLDGPVLPSGAERAILERLQQRREELDTRARELDIRESLIQSAEKRVEAKLSEMKEVEARIKTETQQKDDAEAARFKGLVTMYSNMKPRDAAKIFDGLDDAVLVEVASAIKPQAMAEILAQMQPDVAQRLTVELASKSQQAKPSGDLADLPKIQGQPTAR